MEHSRKDGRQGEHLGSQVGEVSHDKDEARLNDLDVFRASGQKREKYAKHQAEEGAAKRHHKEGNWRQKKKAFIPNSFL